MPNAIIKFIIDTTHNGKGVAEAENGLKNLKKGLNDTVKELTGFNLGQIGAAAAIGAVVAGVSQAIGNYNELANAVREVTNLTGMNAEESSRLLQLSDDYGISQEKLTTILQGANKAGFQPTIENLATLSDSYLALENPLERNKLLIEKFGKSGMDYAEIMKLGGDAIRDKAAEVSADNIVDERGLEISREFQMAQDELGDTLSGVGNTIAKGVMPVITDFLLGLADIVQGIGDILDGGARLRAEFASETKAIASNADSYEEYLDGLRDYEIQQIKNMDATDEMKDALIRQIEASSNAELVQKALADGYTVLSEAQFAQIQTIQDIDQFYVGLSNSSDDYVRSLWDQSYAVVDVNQAMADLKMSMGTELSDSADKFNEKVGDLRDKAQDLQLAIDKLEAKKFLTNEQKGELAGLKTDLQETKGEIDAVTLAHYEQTKKILFNILQQRAAQDGLTATEVDALGKIAVQWGLVDEETANAMTAADEWLGTLQEGVPITKQQLEDLERTMKGLPTSASFNITVGLSGPGANLLGSSPTQYGEEDPDAPVIYGDDEDGVGNGGMLAQGIDTITTKPTMFMTSEYGQAERVVVEPMSGGDGSEKEKISVTVNNYGPLSSDVDYTRLAQAVADEIQRRS